MRDVASQGTSPQEGYQRNDHQCRAWVRELTEAIPEPHTVRTVIAVLEAVYAAHGWTLPGTSRNSPTLCGIVLVLLAWP